MKVDIKKFNKGPSERKIDIQIDKWDTYSLDHTIALIILPALIQLKNTKQGVPSQWISDIADEYDGQRCFDFIKDDRNAVFDEGCKKWDEALDKMIWSFQQLTLEEDYDNKYHHGKIDMGWKSVEMVNPITGVTENMYEMIDKNPNEHWYDSVGHMLHEERIQEGLTLFGKHYRNLWD